MVILQAIQHKCLRKCQSRGIHGKCRWQEDRFYTRVNTMSNKHVEALHIPATEKHYEEIIAPYAIIDFVDYSSVKQGFYKN